MKNSPLEKEKFDLILVGSGFASIFFLHKVLETAPANARILVLEKGGGQESQSYINKTPDKPWQFSLSLGGGSNFWWACTPRFHPNDFRLHSKYGVGVDWPVQYDNLEPFYCEAEEIMQISGEENQKLFPRSKPFPQLPHRGTEPDKLIRKDYPELFLQQPTARARIATPTRPSCCSSSVCDHCPINAKFMIVNDMKDTLSDPRVTVANGYTVEEISTESGLARYVVASHDGRKAEIKGYAIVLGANALFNAHILQRSKLDGGIAGKGLVEQSSITAIYDLNGVENFSGSTSLTGHGYMEYDTAKRAQHAACLLETSNIPQLRKTEGRWRERLVAKFIFEDLPSSENFISTNSDTLKPEVAFRSNSEYCQKGINYIRTKIESLFPSLPIEQVVAIHPNPTEAHIQCTTPMGNDPKTSVVDSKLRHHSAQNLFVLGSGAFPSCPPANPTLTICALSLYAAQEGVLN